MKYLCVLLLFLANPFLYSDNSSDVYAEVIEELPDPPKGFEWYKVEKYKAAFLKPKRWYADSKSGNGAFIIGIAKENFIKKGSFKTGLTVIVTKYEGEEEAFQSSLRNMRDELSRQYVTVSKKDLDFGPLIGFNLLYIMEKEKTGVFMLLVGNPKTKTIYTILFESPQNQFDRNFKKYGYKMINELIVDTDY